MNKKLITTLVVLLFAAHAHAQEPEENVTAREEFLSSKTVTLEPGESRVSVGLQYTTSGGGLVANRAGVAVVDLSRGFSFGELSVQVPAYATQLSSEIEEIIPSAQDFGLGNVKIGAKRHLGGVFDGVVSIQAPTNTNNFGDDPTEITVGLNATMQGARTASLFGGLSYTQGFGGDKNVDRAEYTLGATFSPSHDRSFAGQLNGAFFTDPPAGVSNDAATARLSATYVTGKQEAVTGFVDHGLLGGDNLTLGVSWSRRF